MSVSKPCVCLLLTTSDPRTDINVIISAFCILTEPTQTTKTTNVAGVGPHGGERAPYGRERPYIGLKGSNRSESPNSGKGVKGRTEVNFTHGFKLGADWDRDELITF